MSQEFLGWMRSDDFHRYGSFIDQTRYRNSIVYCDFSAVEPQSPRMIAVYFTLLGLIGKLTGLSAESLWFFSRIIVSWLFVGVLILFIKRWKPDKNIANSALFLVVFSSGIEYLAFINGIQFPRIKNYWMDGFSTFCSFHNPLKMAGITCVLILFLNLDSYLKNRGMIHLFSAAFMIILLWLIHPNSAIAGYTGVMALAILLPVGNFSLSKYIKCWLHLLPLIIPIAMIGLYILWMKTDATTANIIRQYSIKFLTEPYRYYPLRYGLILPLGIMGFAWSYKDRSHLDVMLFGLLLGGEYFAHFAGMSGLLFQHMIHLPLALFAAVALHRFIQNKKASGRYIFGFLILLFLLQNTHVILKVMDQTKRDVWPTSLYLTRGEIQAAKAFRKLYVGHVLVTRDSGNKVAWLSLHHVFLGHWGTTPQKGRKERLVKTFFDMNIDLATKRKILSEYDLKYIWYGPREKQLGRVDHRLKATPVFQNEIVTVFRIDPQKMSSLPSYEKVPLSY
ncbi:hypothetical protein K8T06_04860 [bacterium]|nr:hypothetical protein [bacterium]